MGLLSGLLARLFGRTREGSVLVVGLHNSGKSTIINQLKPSGVSRARCPYSRKLRLRHLPETA